MSRIGKHQVVIPNGVQCSLNGNVVTFKKGNIERMYDVPGCINIEKTSEGLLLKPVSLDQRSRTLWGTSQRNLSNIVKGLDTGFKVDLELVGVGYKAQVNGNKIILQLGYSHDIECIIPEGISVVCPKPTSICISGHCKKQVGDLAALLKSYRKPEPYKGKGVMKSGEFVYRKEGKKK